jgi:hypothetical protein
MHVCGEVVDLDTHVRSLVSLGYNDVYFAPLYDRSSKRWKIQKVG